MLLLRLVIPVHCTWVLRPWELGVGSGDEVIVADSNWIATVAPVVIGNPAIKLQ